MMRVLSRGCCQRRCCDSHLVFNAEQFVQNQPKPRFFVPLVSDRNICTAAGNQIDHRRHRSRSEVRCVFSGISTDRLPHTPSLLGFAPPAHRRPIIGLSCLRRRRGVCLRSFGELKKKKKKDCVCELGRSLNGKNVEGGRGGAPERINLTLMTVSGCSEVLLARVLFCLLPSFV